MVKDSARKDSSIIYVLMVRLGVNKSCLCELRVVTIEKDGRCCRLRVASEMRAEMSRFPDCAHQSPQIISFWREVPPINHHLPCLPRLPRPCRCGS